jgi:hypothetical protein
VLGELDFEVLIRTIPSGAAQVNLSIRDARPVGGQRGRAKTRLTSGTKFAVERRNVGRKFHADNATFA